MRHVVFTDDALIDQLMQMQIENIYSWNSKRCRISFCWKAIVDTYNRHKNQSIKRLYFLMRRRTIVVKFWKFQFFQTSKISSQKRGNWFARAKNFWTIRICDSLQSKARCENFLFDIFSSICLNSFSKFSAKIMLRKISKFHSSRIRHWVNRQIFRQINIHYFDSN